MLNPQFDGFVGQTIWSIDRIKALRRQAGSPLPDAWGSRRPEPIYRTGRGCATVSKHVPE
jgi:hypothetical protein